MQTYKICADLQKHSDQRREEIECRYNGKAKDTIRIKTLMKIGKGKREQQQRDADHVNNSLWDTDHVRTQDAD